MIRVMVSGTLHGEPAQRTSQNGNPYTTANLRADGKDGTSTWCNLIAFGEVAERLATLKPDAVLSVSGRAEVQAWLSKEGEAKAGLSLVVDELVTLRGKPKPPQEEGRQASRRSNDSRRQQGAMESAPPRPPLDDLDDWQP